LESARSGFWGRDFPSHSKARVYQWWIFLLADGER